MRLMNPGGPFLHIMYGMRFGDCSFCSSSSFSTSPVVPPMYCRSSRNKARRPRSNNTTYCCTVAAAQPAVRTQHRRAIHVPCSTPGLSTKAMLSFFREGRTSSPDAGVYDSPAATAQRTGQHPQPPGAPLFSIGRPGQARPGHAHSITRPSDYSQPMEHFCALSFVRGCGVYTRQPRTGNQPQKRRRQKQSLAFSSREERKLPVTFRRYTATISWAATTVAETI